MKDNNFSINLLPGGSEHSAEFLETLLTNNLDGVIYLESIKDKNDIIFDYIVRYYNKRFSDVYNSIKTIDLQPGTLLFELFPGLKKSLVFFRVEKLLKLNQNMEFLKYFDNDGLDHWLSIRITRYLENGYIVNIINKTREVKEKLWSETNLLASELLLKNFYWRVAIPPVLKKLFEISKSTRTNIYFLENFENTNDYAYHLTDSWFDGSVVINQEKSRESISFMDTNNPEMKSIFTTLAKDKIFEWNRTANNQSKNESFFLTKGNLRSIFVPIILHNHLIGIIELENPKGKYLFSRERRVLKNIAECFSAAIYKRLFTKKIEKNEE